MEILLLLAATLLATTTMTLFSYLVSAAFRDLYKEPVLLEYVLSGLDIKTGKKRRGIAGWLLHYLIGLLFIVAYLVPLYLGYYTLSWMSGLVFGAVIGLMGIAGWKIMFRISGRMPMAFPAVYYSQLFFAHIIFGLTTAAFYIYM